MGTVYWIAMGMAMVAVAVVVGLVVAAIVILGVLVAAVVAWVQSLGEARRLGDHAWLRDLILAPALGIAAAALLGRSFQNFGNTTINDFLDRTVNADDAPLWVQVAPLPAGILFFALLFFLPGTLGQHGPRWLAYPGFVFYAVYLTALGFQAADALSGSDGDAAFAGDAAFVGRWQGAVPEPGLTPYTLDMTVVANEGTLIGRGIYPELGCQTEWTEGSRSDDDEKMFLETITAGAPGSCASSASVVAVVDGSDQLVVTFDGSYTATLQRIG